VLSTTVQTASMGPLPRAVPAVVSPDSGRVAGDSVPTGDDVALVRLVGLWSFHGDGQSARKTARSRWPDAEPIPRRWGTMPHPLLLFEQLAALAARRGEHVFHRSKRNSGRPLADAVEADLPPPDTWTESGQTPILFAII